MVAISSSSPLPARTPPSGLEPPSQQEEVEAYALTTDGPHPLVVVPTTIYGGDFLLFPTPCPHSPSEFEPLFM